MSATQWGGGGGVDLSWRGSGNWSLHLNGMRAVATTNDKHLGVSEIDRWRLGAGARHGSFLIRRWSWTFALIGAKPMRERKPNEWSVEIATPLPLSRRLFCNLGWAEGLRESGMEWLFRSGLDFVF